AESQNTIGWISNVHLKWDKLNSGLRKASVQLLPEQPSVLCGYVLKVEGQNTSSGRVQSSQSSLIGRTPLVTCQQFIPVIQTNLGPDGSPSGVNLRQVRIGLEHKDKMDRAVSRRQATLQSRCARLLCSTKLLGLVK
ncbi:hypothetical protein D6C93_01490, partial [Aureobasidium pullulans]